MNTAVLYDANQKAQAGFAELLAGRPLYSYSLKRFYLHSNIDSIVFVWGQEEASGQIIHDIETWKKEYGISKPVWIFHEAETLSKIVRQLKKKDEEKTDLFILHDIRYPFVTDDMIHVVQQKAAVYGLAVMAECIDENISFAENMASTSGQGRLEPENFCCMKFPAAVRSDNHLLQENIVLEKISQKIAENRPYLCRLSDRNPAVYSREELELAEAVMKAGHMVVSL